MSSMWLNRTDLHTPATENFDLSMFGSTDKGPHFIGITFWVDNADLTSIAGFHMDLYYLDPTGNEVILGSNPIPLNDGTARFARPVEMIERLSDVSELQIRCEVVGGSAGAATVAWRIMLTSAFDIEFQELTLTPNP